MALYFSEESNYKERRYSETKYKKTNYIKVGNSLLNGGAREI